MKTLGTIIIALSFVGLFFSATMKTTISVPYEFYSRPVGAQSEFLNIGLLNSKSNYMMLSGIGILAGVLLLGFGYLKEDE